MPETQEPVILWCGRFSKSDGYGTVSKNHLKGLRSIGARVAAYDVDLQRLVGPQPPVQLEVTRQASAVEIKPRDERIPLAVIYHERPDHYTRLKVNGRARFIGHSVFETDNLPPDWPEFMVAADELWVASEFNYRTFVNSGIPAFMLHTVPHSIDPDLYPEPQRQTGSGTTFLTVISGFARRDLSLLFRAFLAAFDREDDVRLIVKLRDSYTDVRTAEVLLRDAVGSAPVNTDPALSGIEFRAGNYTNEQMSQLYQECDVYVSVERASGWDLPVMEAMASGKTTIGFDWGGATQYATPDVGLRLPVGAGYDYISSLGPQSPMYTAQLWPTVDQQDLVEALKWCHKHPAERAEMGQRALQHLRDNFSSDVVAGAIVKRVGELTASDYRRHTPASVVHSGRGESAWGRVAIPTRVHIATDGVMGSIAAVGQIPTMQIKQQLEAYKSASNLRSLRAISKMALDQTPALRMLGQAMKVSPRRPLKKALSIAQFLAAARSVSDSTNGLELVSQGIAEFWRGEDGEALPIDDGLVNRRRKVWGKYGGIPLSPEDAQRLSGLRDIHRGRRIFIMGNGPSLNSLDLSKLEDEWTFGVNKIYLLFDRIGWRPSFWTAMDWRVGPDIKDDFSLLDGITKFVPYRFRGMLPSDEDTYWYHSRPVGDYINDQFEVDITRGVPSRGTVLVTAIQLAFFLGFRELILIGVDASYKIPDTVIQSGGDFFGTGVMLNLQSTADDDPNHFDPRYFGKGAKWHDPNVNEMIRMFHTMRRGIEYMGGQIVNATPGGNLEVFERVHYDDLF